MPTSATSHVAVRNRTALVESVLGHSVDWSALPDPGGYIAQVLGVYDRPSDPRFRWADLHGRVARYFEHAGQDPVWLLELIKARSVDGRAKDPMVGWTEEGVGEERENEPGLCRVLGWTSTPILRSTLSRRLDSLNPVAAFRLLEQPEIGVLERSNRDYIVLRHLQGHHAGASNFAGAIRARDLDLWHSPEPGELDGAFALTVDDYRNRFAGTGVAA